MKQIKNSITVYKAKKNWHWRMNDARNDRLIGASTKGYRNRHALVSNLERVTGVNYIPRMRYGTKLLRFQIWRDGDGCAIYHD